MFNGTIYRHRRSSNRGRTQPASTHSPFENQPQNRSAASVHTVALPDIYGQVICAKTPDLDKKEYRTNAAKKDLCPANENLSFGARIDVDTRPCLKKGNAHQRRHLDCGGRNRLFPPARERFHQGRVKKLYRRQSPNLRHHPKQKSQVRHGAGHFFAVGQLFIHRRIVFFLAVGVGPDVRLGLRHRPRSRPSGPHEPFGLFLANSQTNVPANNTCQTLADGKRKNFERFPIILIEN